MNIINKNKSAFSIIEVLIGIFIFTMWMLSVYMLLQSSFNINEDNKNRIVAANLAREGIELVRNIRDSNYKNVHKWNQINPKLQSDFDEPENLFQTWVYYKIWNNFDWIVSEFPIKMENISNFWEWKSELDKMENYKLCLDTENKYGYCDLNFTKKTNFYRYVKFEDLTYESGSTNFTEPDSYTLTSKVLWYYKWLHEVEIKTVLTDYKKL